ncbi:MAG: hexitol phosphatase HxpB [Myxococcota bacterium]|nr:hexitol phosphatase HxpB [Myxococcota bacterium]
MLEAVIFDMDGLLIDSEPHWAQAEMEVFGSVGLTLTTEMCRETTGFRLDATVNHWYDRAPWTGPTREDIVSAIGARVAELVALHGMPLPGVEHVVALAEERGVKLALCSSSPYVIIDKVVSKLGLRGRLSVTYSAEDEPLGKPHPGAYITTASLLRVACEDCLVLEDSVTGAIAAKAARMRVIAVPQGAATRFTFCDAVVPSLEVVSAELLDRLFPTSVALSGGR